MPTHNAARSEIYTMARDETEEMSNKRVLLHMPFILEPESATSRFKRLCSMLAPLEINQKGDMIFKFRRYPEPKLITWKGVE